MSNSGIQSPRPAALDADPSPFGAGDGAGLHVAGLGKSYGLVTVLEGVDLHARPGEIHALLGENGAGKSTLMKVLSGVIHADAGRIALDGEQLTLGSPDAARSHRIRTVFQELSLVPDLTVAENLLIEQLPTRPPLGTIGRRRLLRDAAALLDAAALEGIDPRRRVAELSLAVRQQLELAKALRVAPSVLILDEATSALGPSESDWVLAHARAQANAGAVVIMISHRIAEVRGHADRLTILRSGHSVATGTPGEFDDDALIEQMLGRRVERLYPERAPARERVVLRARGLHVPGSFGPQDFELREGEILGVGGLEGQGQRSLMMALAGAVPWHGELELDGEPVRYRSPRGAIASGVVFVPEDRQSEGLLLSHSIRSNIALSSVGRLRGRFGSIDAGAERTATEREARAVGLDVARLGEPARNLSGGNQQKVVLARALLTEPKVLLLYDCTRGIDVGSKADIMAALAQLTDRGVAVVYYSSDAAELVHLCDRVMVVRGQRFAGTLDRGPALGEQDILHLAVGTRGDEDTTEAAA